MRRLWQDSGKTVVLVTHDVDEAIGLSDEVVVLSAGPATEVIGRHEIDIARPRAVMELRDDPGYQRIHRKIWEQLRDEVMRSHERVNR